MKIKTWLISLGVFSLSILLGNKFRDILRDIYQNMVEASGDINIKGTASLEKADALYKA